jgi:hypothetical protein
MLDHIPIRVIRIYPLPTHVEVSKRRHAKYWKTKDKLTKEMELKLKSNKIYPHRDGYYRGFDNKKIIKNTKSVNTPNLVAINGQLIYNNQFSGVERSLYIQLIKKVLKPFIIKITPITEFPIKFTCTVFREFGRGDWDLDNLWIYTKVIQDLMVDEKIIPEDNVKYISQSMGFKYVPIPPDSTPAMVVEIYKEVDPTILKQYKSLLNNGKA